MADQWIVIPNWGKFQHYKDRNPPWIKLYTELAKKDEWQRLTLHQRGVLVTIWLEYALTSGQVSVRSLSGNPQLGLRVSSVQLKALSDAGFIALVASKPLALAHAREETETETERKPTKKKAPRVKVTGWRMVRGSHGMTFLPDPFGTDKPPSEWGAPH